jgi:hypothetical protein
VQVQFTQNGGEDKDEDAGRRVSYSLDGVAGKGWLWVEG